MKFFTNIYKTALHIAVEKENLEMIKLLLSQENIFINQHLIQNKDFFISFCISII